MANKTKIEWCDYTINPVKGLCPVGCSYCYARAMYHRYKWDTEIQYSDWVWQKGSPMPAGSRIFVGSTIDLFHEKTIQFLPAIMENIENIKSRTFIFLTKCPENLPREWPDNCWVGVSVTNRQQAHNANFYLPGIDAKVKFVSFEPLLDDVMQSLYCYPLIQSCQWVIIGQQTPVRASTMPKVEWIKEIVAAADIACTPVFLKDNLRNFYPAYLRQEFPVLEVARG